MQVPMGETQTLTLGGVFGSFTAVAADPKIVDLAPNGDTRTVAVSGKSVGSTTITVTDSRNISVMVGVRVAYVAGSIPNNISLQITGDPASPDYLRDLIQRAITRQTQTRPGAQVVLDADSIGWRQNLAQDNVQSIDVPVLVQGEQYFDANGSTGVTVRNVAVPRIPPDILMVSDFPEKLTENGVLFEADLKRGTPSRFLYFHYNPPGQPDRRIVLVAENHGNEPANVQIIDGRGGPTKNEMEAGHLSTKNFLVNEVQNQGHLVVVPANSSRAVVMQDLPASNIVQNLMQLRVLEGPDLHLTLIAQNATDDPENALTPALQNAQMLTSTVRHARGIYAIPEFHYARQWNVNEDYLELPVGQLPLPNALAGEALSGDYGVLQSFVVNVQNPTSSPQHIAIYENPRGGAATGTYIIDGTLVQSHRVPAYSRYKVRQYVVPARGFVRVTIVTMPEGGSSYPLRLEFAPDDGSVPPGAPGSPVY